MSKSWTNDGLGRIIRAFCERARQCGFRVLADTTLRLWHVGASRFSWEEAGNDVQRFADYTYHLNELFVLPRSGG